MPKSPEISTGLKEDSDIAWLYFLSQTIFDWESGTYPGRNSSEKYYILFGYIKNCFYLYRTI